MLKFEFCLPTMGKIVPSDADWFHEVKYDGYRLRVEREADRVRLITRGGHDWTKRSPCIVEAALKKCRTQFVIDGEAVVLGVDGVSDFNALYFERRVVWDWKALVSKRSDHPYRGGRTPHWIKVKNRKHPAMERVMEAYR
jgi:ATP-dependent DNA ligase